MLRVAEQFSGSDVGRQRQGNEDAFFVDPPLFVVADGMGGAQSGEVASDMAVRSFEAGLGRRDPAEALVAITRAANRRIHERSRHDTGRAGMGTTLTAAYLTADDRVLVAHVGDSRCYVLRDGELMRLTRDHSLVEELVARGKLTEEQAESHPQRSVITRALGPEPDVDVDVDIYPARAGDIFLLCSDGLTSMIAERQIEEILTAARPLERRGRDLISAANQAGGRDNITVVLFRVEPDAAGERPTVLTGAVAAPAGERRGADAETQDTAALRIAPQRPRAGARPAPAPAGEAAAATGAGERPAETPARRSRPRGGRLLKALALFVLFVVPILLAAWFASREVYFVGVDEERGRAVTIYRGLPYELPGGVTLYDRFYSSGVTIDAVPPARREVFADQQLRSRADAEDLVIRLERGELNR